MNRKTILHIFLYCGVIFLFSHCKGDDNPTSPQVTAPTVTTTAISSLAGTTAVGGGNVTADGGSPVTERGICWSQNQNPTIADNKVSSGTGTGSFTCNISGLTIGTTYYVKAYATSSAGTQYGLEVSFKAKDTYFDQDLPGETPILFADSKLKSLDKWAGATELSPDGKIFFATIGSSDYTTAKIYYSKKINNSWTAFEPAPFVSDFLMSTEPMFSHDGTKVTFTGKRRGGVSGDFWTTTLSNNTWSDPVALPVPINSEKNEWRGSYSTDGTFYFGSTRTGGMNQVYKYTPGASAAEKLGAPINAQSYDGDPLIDPDGHYMIFYSGRSGGIGGTDLYVSFSDGSGGWKTPINLGSQYNSQYDEYGPHLSSDGRFLFFTRHSYDREYTYWVAITAIEKINH